MKKVLSKNRCNWNRKRCRMRLRSFEQQRREDKTKMGCERRRTESKSRMNVFGEEWGKQGKFKMVVMLLLVMTIVAWVQVDKETRQITNNRRKSRNKQFRLTKKTRQDWTRTCFKSGREREGEIDAICCYFGCVRSSAAESILQQNGHHVRPSKGRPSNPPTFSVCFFLYNATSFVFPPFLLL